MDGADLIFFGGQVITMDSHKRICRGVAIKNKKVLAVGDDEEVLPLKGKDTRVINLQGRTILPGFIDSHVHFTQTGLNTLGIDLRNVKGLSEMFDVLKERASTANDGELIFGIGYDDEQMIERRPPTIEELDEVIPDKPVFLFRIESHSMVVNSMALKVLDLPMDTEGLELDDKGKPTGILRANANSLGRSRYLDLIDDDTRRLAIQRASLLAIENGVTTLNALEGGKLFNDRDVEVLLRYKNELPVHIEVFFQTMDVDKVLSYGLRRIGGCLILDGSFGSRTAALLEPYSDDSKTNGVLYYTQKEITEFVERAHREELQITVHALGDRAIEQILTAYEGAMEKYPKENMRHRIEHLELPTKKQIRRASKLGVIFSMQPAFEYLWGGKEGMYGRRLGEERTQMTNPYRTIIQEGGLIIGGSDSDVTPISPLLGIQGAVTHSNPKERVDIYEAIQMFTINGAKGLFLEKKKGSIEIGKDGDLVLLSQNPMETDLDKIKEIDVHMTIKDGTIIYQKDF